MPRLVNCGAWLIGYTSINNYKVNTTITAVLSLLNRSRLLADSHSCNNANNYGFIKQLRLYARKNPFGCLLEKPLLRFKKQFYKKAIIGSFCKV